MSSRSIINYVFILALAGLLGAWGYATYNMILMATGSAAGPV